MSGKITNAMLKVSLQRWDRIVEISSYISSHGSTWTLANCFKDDDEMMGVYVWLTSIIDPPLLLSIQKHFGYDDNEFNDIARWLRTLKSDIECINFGYDEPAGYNYTVRTVLTRHFAPQVFEGDKAGYVYLLQAILPTEYPNCYKIGLSKDPIDRIDKLGVILPFPIEPLYQFPTNDRYRAENTLHNRYQYKRINGEWFGLSKQDVGDILAIEFMNFEVQS